MAKESSAPSGYIKKETVMLIALIAFVLGFLGGIVFYIFKSDPGPAVQQQAQIQPQVDQKESAILALEQDVLANPNNRQAWVTLGHNYFDTNRFEKAIFAYNKALALNANDPNVLTDLGVMYRRSKQPNKAIESFDKAIALEPSHPTARFNKGVVLIFDMNDREGGLAVWQELVDMNPGATAPDGSLVSEIIVKMRAEDTTAK